MKIIHDLDVEGKIKIVQDSDKNSFTFDSILLANFTNIKKKDNNAIDFCTGNAPIAMLLNFKKKIDIIGVEIQKEICDLANESIELNNIDNIKIINDDIKGISSKLKKNYYDIITCNPPYFRVEEHSNINSSNSISIARHEILLKLEDVINEAKMLLNNTGSLNLVHRPDRLDELIILLDKYNFSINRLQMVYPSINKPCNTILIEAKKGKKSNNKMKICEPIFVYDQENNYTKQAKKIMEMKG